MTDSLAPTVSWVSSVSDETGGTGPVLVVRPGESEATRSVDLAAAMAESRDTDLAVCRPVVTPEGAPLGWPLPDEPRGGQVHREQRIADERVDVTVTQVTSSGPSLVSAVERAVDRVGASTVVLDASPSQSVLERLFGDVTDRLARTVPCDVVVTNGAGSVGDLASILVPVAGGQHSGLAVDVAGALAVTHDAWVDLYHVVDPDASDRTRECADRYLTAAEERLSGLDRVDTWLCETADVAGSIVEQSRYYDLTVVGAPETSRLRRFVFGSQTAEIRAEADSPVVTVWQPRGVRRWYD
ncbi:universal stress protein [Haloarchaeobius sp. DFWS5]|uniref:universal stress protein n=1 Tax=Haloarchaeobius sp. DFWS5 TaxID=3446114 RepID=UPI003EBF95F1